MSKHTEAQIAKVRTAEKSVQRQALVKIPADSVPVNIVEALERRVEAALAGVDDPEVARLEAPYLKAVEAAPDSDAPAGRRGSTTKKAATKAATTQKENT